MRPAIADDDPFAELTRIMGFDPREPARTAAPAAMAPTPTRQAEPVLVPPLAPAVEPDFSIDLERELMGEFGGNDVYALDEPIAASAVLPEPRAEIAVAAPLVSDEIAASDKPDRRLPLSAAPGADQGEVHDDVEVRASDDAPGTDAHPARQSAELDMEDEFFLALDGELASEAQSEAGRAEPIESEPIATLIADDLASEVSRTAESTGLEGFDPTPEILPSYDEMRHAVAQGDAAELDMAAGADDDEPDEVAAEWAPAATALSGFVAVPQDASLVEGLEEELNALLGSEANSFAPAPPTSEVRAEPASASPVDPFDAPAHEHVFQAREPDVGSYEAASSGETIADLSDAQAWLDQQRADVDQNALEAVAVSAAIEEPLDAGGHDDFDLDLDDHGFDAALSNAIAGDLGDERQPEPTYAPEPTDVNAASTAKEPESMSRDGNDPYAALAALSANLKKAPSWPERATAPIEPQHGAAAPVRAVYERPEAPEIETVDVPEYVVALADDLDLPEFAYEDEAPNLTRDDFEAEFATLLNDMKSPEPEVESAAAPRHDDTDRRGAAAAGAVTLRTTELRQSLAFDDDDFEASPTGAAQADPDLDYDPDFEDDVIPSAYIASAEQPRQRRGLLVAAVVGGVALIGAVGAYALASNGQGGNGEIALVKADPAPVKVKPENPGGVAIANQDNKVYDTVGGGTQPVQPKQEKLLSSAEEPVDIPIEEEAEMADSADDTMPGLMQDGAEDASDASPAAGTAGRVAAAPTTAKSEDRVAQTEADNAGVDDTVEVSAVPPRKVRTMIVKADGTLVAREETEAPVAARKAASASESIVDHSAPSVAQDAISGDIAPAETAAPTAAKSQAEAVKASETPKSIPIAPSRPSDQPVDIVGATKPEQVASLAPAATGGAWAMQIASQPSEAAAKSSYQDLVRRYGTVLDGHQASIVKAEITGKGTFWRVRVPAGGRSDAIQLCERYKAAGGSCFVSK